MKKLKFILILLLSIGIWSCEDDDADIDIFRSETVEGTAVLNTPNVVDFEITETTDVVDGNENETATTFTWTKVKGSYNGTILYLLEMDIKGNNFKNGVYVPLGGQGTTELSQEISNKDLNMAVNAINTQLVTSGSALKVDFSTATEFDIRVVSMADVSKDKSFSEPITINVNAYEKIVVIEPQLFITGSVQSYYGKSNWNPEQGLEMRYIGDGTTKVFEAYLKATEGDAFKFISNQAVWDNIVGNYGVIDGAQDGNLINSGDSGNIEIPEEGQYYIKVDIDNLTYELIKMQWGVIGNATPDSWDGETPMTYDFNTNTWEITLNLTDGEVKFRSKSLSNAVFGAGEDWKFNVGTNLNAWDDGDGNFVVSAGSTTITLKIGFKGDAVITGI
ncbi:MAG: SusE domain-containing protein [Lutibacter sp.]|nr:SusE domain-containing protein [Lutibacter sp.]